MFTNRKRASRNRRRIRALSPFRSYAATVRDSSFTVRQRNRNATSLTGRVGSPLTVVGCVNTDAKRFRSKRHQTESKITTITLMTVRIGGKSE